MVPHLVTALTGPINELEQRILDSMPAIERWFRLEWMEHTPPFYSSVDIRNAGFKLAPVDTNLFPRGWNNLTARDAAAGGAGRAGRDREDLPRGAQPAGDPGEPLAQHLLPGQRGAAGAHLPHGGAQRARRLDRPGDQVAQEDRAAATARRCAWSRWCAASGAWGSSTSTPAPSCSTTTCRPARPASWKTCTSSTCCRRCMPAGRCAARATTSTATKKCPSASASCWASTPG